MPKLTPTRRTFLTAAAAAGAGLPMAARAERIAIDDFQFEVQYTNEEWIERLTVEQYEILRKNGTEWPGSSPLSKQYETGSFYCQGCGLKLFDSVHRVRLDKGWVFFRHAEPLSVLMDIDTEANYSGTPGNERTLIEVICRRCGSHLGHLLMVDGQLVHCINGTALEFRPAAA
ncbi:MAG: peptide-methionine (R)-S-oxide reductase [Pseudomonadota bacterium]